MVGRTTDLCREGAAPAPRRRAMKWRFLGDVHANIVDYSEQIGGICRPISGRIKLSQSVARGGDLNLGAITQTKRSDQWQRWQSGLRATHNSRHSRPCGGNPSVRRRGRGVAGRPANALHVSAEPRVPATRAGMTGGRRGAAPRFSRPDPANPRSPIALAPAPRAANACSDSAFDFDPNNIDTLTLTYCPEAAEPCPQTGFRPAWSRT